MPGYIFYGKTVVAVIEGGQITLDPEGIEKSGMPPGWKPHIERCLLNALPEGTRFDSLLILASHNSANPNPENLIELVPYLDDLPGHFSAGDTPIPSEDKIRRYVPLPDVLPAGEIRSRLPVPCLHPQSALRMTAKPSFSGYQDKFVAKLAVEDGRLALSLPDPAERGNVIVKPADPNHPYIGENEYVCMKLAQSLGFNVPRVFLFRQKDVALEAERQRQHFLIERFDYGIDDEGRPQKVVTTEIASLMDLSSETKYDTTTEKLFETAEKSLPPDDMREFARMYFFGALVHNGDMHAKNFSFILDPESRDYRLAPLYDCLCTAIYGFHDVLALPLNGTNRPKPEAFVRFMISWLSAEEMRAMGTLLHRNLDSALDLAFDYGEHKVKTARKRLRGAIIERTRPIVEAIEAVVQT
ncbi:MAG: HipA domain-containing protein [Synergistaceae bacterium]|jgi:hypothetical protein|nr:HipA domain-containing protein [Synergistaceae bacterium]